MSLHINQCLCISINVSAYQSMSLHINQRHSLSLSVSPYQSMSLHINQRHSISLNIIIIKTSSTGTSLINKVVYKFLLQPHKHLSHGKLKKTQLREATNDWLHSWTHPAFRVPVSNSVGKVIPHLKLFRLETLCKLWRSTRCCCSLVSVDSKMGLNKHI